MRTVLILLALAFGLQACGLKGPLVLPPSSAKPAPAPVPTPSPTPTPTPAQDKPAG